MPASTHLPLLAVDKSFAQASRGADLTALAKFYMLVVPDAFYHEVFTTEASKRHHALIGFPDFRRIHIPTYLQRERLLGEPACGTAESEIPVLSFNPDVVSPGWTMAPDHESVINERASQVVDPSIAFWKSIIGQRVAGFSDEEYLTAKRSPERLHAVCATIRDTARVRSFAREIEFPHAEKLDPRWFQFRRFQVMMLQGLILNFRYPVPDVTPDLERIEHDVHDLDYLVLGLVTGNLATAETSEKPGKASMGWRFKLLLPEGHLLTPTHLPPAPSFS